jgi:leucyl-tRNA synthetase
MASRQIVIEVPEKVLLAEKADESAFARELRVLAAVKLYELGRLSSGRAAELADVFYLLAEGLRILATLIWPVIPQAAEEIWRRLGLAQTPQQVAWEEQRRPRSRLGRCW